MPRPANEQHPGYPVRQTNNTLGTPTVLSIYMENALDALSSLFYVSPLPRLCPSPPLLFVCSTWLAAAPLAR